jgi:hypothetical protein
MNVITDLGAVVKTWSMPQNDGATIIWSKNDRKDEVRF